MESDRPRAWRTFWIGLAFLLIWFLVLPVFFAGSTPMHMLAGLVILLIFALALWLRPAARVSILWTMIGAVLGMGMLTGSVMVVFIEQGFSTLAAAAWGLLLSLVSGGLAGFAITRILQRLIAPRAPANPESVLTEIDDR